MATPLADVGTAAAVFAGKAAQTKTGARRADLVEYRRADGRIVIVTKKQKQAWDALKRKRRPRSRSAVRGRAALRLPNESGPARGILDKGKPVARLDLDKGATRDPRAATHPGSDKWWHRDARTGATQDKRPPAPRRSNPGTVNGVTPFERVTQLQAPPAAASAAAAPTSPAPGAVAPIVTGSRASTNLTPVGGPFPGGQTGPRSNLTSVSTQAAARTMARGTQASTRAQGTQAQSDSTQAPDSEPPVVSSSEPGPSASQVGAPPGTVRREVAARDLIDAARASARVRARREAELPFRRARASIAGDLGWDSDANFGGPFDERDERSGSNESMDSGNGSGWIQLPECGAGSGQSLGICPDAGLPAKRLGICQLPAFAPPSTPPTLANGLALLNWACSVKPPAHLPEAYEPDFIPTFAQMRNARCGFAKPPAAASGRYRLSF